MEIGFNSTPCQELFLSDTSPRKSFRGARCVGKTTMAKVEALKKAKGDDDVLLLYPNEHYKASAMRSSFPDFDHYQASNIRVESMTSLSLKIFPKHIIVDEVDMVDWGEVYRKTIRDNLRLKTISIVGTPRPNSIFAFAENSPQWSNYHVPASESELHRSREGWKDLSPNIIRSEEMARYGDAILPRFFEDDDE